MAFTYWHINYDAPVIMEFQGEEMINGLKVQRYETNYHADQTKELDYLPGVPEERGVNLDINLKLWIEPVTGHLVKYHDQATAYYYDIKTGERTHPWNKFENVFTDESVRTHVEIAKREKYKILIMGKIIPGLIGIIGLLLLLIVLIGRRKHHFPFFLILRRGQKGQ